MPEETPQPFSAKLLREGEDNVLRVDVEGITRVPSIEDDPIFMQRAHELLIKYPNTTKIVFVQKRDYEYDYPQVKLLAEIAHLYSQLLKQKDKFGYQAIAALTNDNPQALYNELHTHLTQTLISDPAGAFVELRRIARRQHIALERAIHETERRNLEKLFTLIQNTLDLLGHTKLITTLKPHLAGYRIGDRDIYRLVFNPAIKPDFMFTKLMASYPQGAEEIETYTTGQTEVVIFKLPGTVQYLYHIMPPEFKLTEDRYELLDQARNIMAEHKPQREEFVDPERMREVFAHVGRDLLEELAASKNINLSEEELNELTNVLLRYTIGFGLIEILLADPKVQDITINSPLGHSPAFLVHADHGECRTNIIPTPSDAESWASKLRIMSGRPLDEADPILDTEILIPGIANARVGVIAPPLNPTQIAYAFRRHRDKPWTIPLFIHTRMLSPLAAGLISFLIDGNRTMLVAGTRSAGKTSLLGSMMVEIMRRYRILTIEDTLELPTPSLRKLGYNIQPMKVASALSRGTSEVSAEDGIRTTLRLGDSALIIGEVRSKEARALYEAMRVGALANVVAGTIHGDSPYGVFDRVVNDLGVPRTSFKATDIIIVANPVRSADGLKKWRRVTKITEVRKEWENDPLREGGFVDLMTYNPKTDQLEPTPELINGNSDILKAIAGNVREWAGNWNAVWKNIELRAKTKEALVTAARETSSPELLEAEFVIKANDAFHRAVNDVKEKQGRSDPDAIYQAWSAWLAKELKDHTLKKAT
ncbi:hypothetical protein D6783_04070 [Candidatus Woesearchaeota archaeon]|nr:MAG: hypothetical protein D6783_04070 [Candidatus Woesearchaeota archaeon]